MKWLSAILAIIVLTLSMQPVCVNFPSVETCCNEEQHCDEGANKNTAHNSEEHGRNCSNDGCNPFQYCNCCVFHVLIPFRFSYTATASAVVPVKKYLYHQMYLPGELAAEFWKPPRFI